MHRSGMGYTLHEVVDDTQNWEEKLGSWRVGLPLEGPWQAGEIGQQKRWEVQPRFFTDSCTWAGIVSATV